MSAPVLKWPRADKVLRGYLRSRASCEVYTRVPEDAEAAAPFIAIQRLPGPPAGGIPHKVFTFDVEVFAGSFGELWDLVRDVEMWLDSMPTEQDSGVYVDDVEVTAEFGDAPYGGSPLERAVGTVDLTFRPQQ